MREAHKRGELVLGEPFKIRTFNRGTEAKMHYQARQFRGNILRHLDKHYPLGKFTTQLAPSPDPLGGYDVFVIYYGEAPDKTRKTKFKRRNRKRQVTKPKRG
jgi:hypothetical protein